MGEGETDALELLLPGADPGTVERARRITTFLRLLVDDARARAGETVGLGLDRARAEMAHRQRSRSRDLVEDLLRHHLRVLADPSSFLQPPPPWGSLQELWSELERHREAEWKPPSVPAPGEGASEGADRLLASLGSLEEAGSPRLAVWRAWCLSAREEAGGGEEVWHEILASHRSGSLPRALEVECLEAVARCRLDRGAVRRAGDWLDEHLGVVSSEPSLCWLLAWTQLLGGDAERARATVQGIEPPPGPLPRPLAELRGRMPSWAALLPGTPLPAPAGGSRPATRPGDRGRWGAAVLAVFAVAPGKGVRLVHADAAPALAHGLEHWRRDREATSLGPGEPEHRLFVRAAAVLDHRTGRTPLAGALGPAGSLALAREPVLDEEGEVRGWIHLECEHHLLPPGERRRALAEAWRERVLAEADEGSEDGARRTEETRAGRTRAPARSGADDGLAPGDPRAVSAREFLAGLGLKTALRRWWCFDVQGEEVTLVDEAGGALADWRAARGGGRARRRALATSSAILYPERDPGLAQCAAAASGVAVPFVDPGGVRALLVVESTRRGDFHPRDAERLAAAARAWAPRWRAAQFRAWHVARFGHDVHLDPEGVGVGEVLRDLPVTGRARSPVALVGPEGVGKEVLARWIHFEGGAPDSPLVVRACAVDEVLRPARTIAPGESGGGGEGTVLLDALEELPLPGQLQLAARLGRGRTGADAGDRRRFLATLRRPLAGYVAEGRLRGDLAAFFQRLELVIPPLRDRRDEIPPLLRLLLGRFAAEEGTAVATLTEEAMALLWRQPWEGNVRELEGIAYKLAVFHPGERVGVEALRALAGRFHIDLAARLPSRHPRPADVLAALRVTRCASGSPNKTRAALYLGWDPDTLAARLRDSLPGGAEERAG